MGHSKIERISCYLGMLNGSLAMSVTFQKFSFLSCSLSTGNNFTISCIARSRSHKSVMCYSLFSNVKPINMSVSISIAHQLIDISKFSFCHFHYIMHIKKLLNENKIASSGIWTYISKVNSWCATIYTKLLHHIHNWTQKLKKLHI